MWGIITPAGPGSALESLSSGMRLIQLDREPPIRHLRWLPWIQRLYSEAFLEHWLLHPPWRISPSTLQRNLISEVCTLFSQSPPAIWTKNFIHKLSSSLTTTDCYREYNTAALDPIHWGSVHRQVSGDQATYMIQPGLIWNADVEPSCGVSTSKMKAGGNWYCQLGGTHLMDSLRWVRPMEWKNLHIL